MDAHQVVLEVGSKIDSLKDAIGQRTLHTDGEKELLVVCESNGHRWYRVRRGNQSTQFGAQLAQAICHYVNQ